MKYSSKIVLTRRTRKEVRFFSFSFLFFSSVLLLLLSHITIIVAVIARLAEKKLLRAHILTLKEEKSLIGVTLKKEGEYKTNPLWRKEL
jgi:hypothetical protein